MSLTVTMHDNYPHSMGHLIPYDLDLEDSGNYTQGGDPITVPPLVKASVQPVFVEFQLPPGFVAQLNSNIAPNTIQFFSGAGVELTPGAPYPVGLAGLPKIMRVWCRKNI